MSAGRLGATKASKSDRRPQRRSHDGRGGRFLADLNRTWEKHGQETLDRLCREDPVAYFAVVVELAKIHQRQLPEPPGFDRRRYRAGVMDRLQERMQGRR
jgi:hypothetical protein